MEQHLDFGCFRKLIRATMENHDYLSLKEAQLDSNATWKSFGSGFILVFIKNGEAKFISGPITQRLTRGDVFAVNSVFDGALCTSDKQSLSFLHFSGSIDHLYPLFVGHEIALLQQIADNFKRPQVFSAGNPIATECFKLAIEAQDKTGLDHRSHLLKIVSVILSEAFQSAQNKRTSSMGAEDHIIHVFERLSVTELLSLSVDEIAAKFNCSRRHLSRLFHQYFGFSVGSLKMEIRLLKAISLLRDPNAKVINVAEEAGFNHLGLFNTCFKRRFGVSPGEWRKLTAQSNKTEGKDHPITCQQLTNGMCPLMVSSAGCEQMMRNLQVMHAQRPGNSMVLDDAQAG